MVPLVLVVVVAPLDPPLVVVVIEPVPDVLPPVDEPLPALLPPDVPNATSDGNGCGLVDNAAAGDPPTGMLGTPADGTAPPAGAPKAPAAPVALASVVPL